MPARRTKPSKRRTPARRKGVRKTIVTLKPLQSGKAADAVATSGVASSGVATSGKAATGKAASGEDAAQAKILELEAENRRLKVQLADQRNSSTMISAPLARSERSYKGMAITFAFTTVVLIVVVLLLKM